MPTTAIDHTHKYTFSSECGSQFVGTGKGRFWGSFGLGPIAADAMCRWWVRLGLARFGFRSDRAYCHQENRTIVLIDFNDSLS